MNLVQKREGNKEKITLLMYKSQMYMQYMNSVFVILKYRMGGQGENHKILLKGVTIK